MTRNTQERDRVLQFGWWIVAAIAFGLVISIRIRLLGIPLERDEGEYAYAGQLMLQGIPPYKLAYNMKFPGTYAGYALIMAIFGQTIAGIHLGLLVLNAAAVVLIFFVGRRLIDSTGGIAAAASYAVMSVSPSVFGWSAHATHFVIVPVLGGILLLLKDSNQRSVGTLFFSGLLFGIGVLMKQPAIAFVLFGAIYLVISNVREKSVFDAVIRRTLIFAAGVVAPIAITFLLLWRAGVFGQFWFWTIAYARQYGGLIPLTNLPGNFAAGIGKVIGSTWLLWLLAAFGVAAGLWHKPLRSSTGFLLALLAFAMLGVSAGFYFREHYFILILPVIALLVGLAITRLAVLAAKQANAIRYLPPLLLCLALVTPIFWARNVFLQAPLEQVCRIMYGGNPFPEAIKIAEYIRDHSAPDDTIAVLGSEPQIYFYARRRSATGHIYMYGLMEAQSYARRMQEEMIREIELARPKYLVSVEIRASWVQRPDSERLIVNWANDYMRNHYDLVGLVAIWQEGADYYLGKLPKSPPPLGNYVLILQRKS